MSTQMSRHCMLTLICVGKTVEQFQFKMYDTLLQSSNLGIASIWQDGCARGVTEKRTSKD